MKAYKVSCNDIDSHGCLVVFAESPQEARRHHRERCDCPYIEKRAVRAKDFDNLSPGPVTTQQYLDRGWYWECSCCGKQLHGDDKPIILDEHVFCSREKVAEYYEQTKGFTHESWTTIHAAIREYLEPPQ